MPKIPKTLTDPAVKKYRARDRRYDVKDSSPRGFFLRVHPSGAKTFYVESQRNKRWPVGNANDPDLTLSKAREKARTMLAEIKEYGEPLERQKRKADTLREFLNGDYLEWARENLSDGITMCKRVISALGKLADKKLPEITPFDLERWRAARLKAGKQVSTLNRETAQIRVALKYAVAWKLITVNPMDQVKQKKADNTGRVRYLSDKEEKRLLAAVMARKDHLTPMVILALNSGLRRGEIFNLRWRDVKLTDSPMLTAQGSGTKSKQTRYVPLNEVATSALKAWKVASDDAGPDAYIFPNPDTGKRLDSIKTAWATLVTAAHISDFRFHDCRHHFASKLIMSGIDLNTVRELLGHADLKMTLRYAHLSPDHKRAAVEVLIQ